MLEYAMCIKNYKDLKLQFKYSLFYVAYVWKALKNDLRTQKSQDIKNLKFHLHTFYCVT